MGLASVARWHCDRTDDPADAFNGAEGNSELPGKRNGGRAKHIVAGDVATCLDSRSSGKLGQADGRPTSARNVAYHRK